MRRGSFIPYQRKMMGDDMSKIEFEPQDNTCLICGTDRLRKFKAYASDAAGQTFINMIECKHCLFAWQYPLGRSEQQSVQFFETAYADEGQTQSEYFNPDYKREIAKLEYEFLTSLPGSNRTLLDIGAGPGIFAEVAAEHDWKVTAVDPALDIDRIRHNSLIRAIKGTTKQLSSEEFFDIVTMWDVIEHTTNPLKQIFQAKYHLKDGGWLVIETGNYKSVSRVKRGKNSWMYQLEHRWYFSPESIKHLLKKAGFSEFILVDRVFRPDWNGKVSYAGPSRVRLFKSIVKDPLHLLSHLSKYFYLMKAKGWEIPGIHVFTIAARKPGLTG